MDVLRSLVVAFLVTAFGIATALGDEWTSPDGVVAVAVPDPAAFQRMDDPPEPFLVLWISKDETLRLGVIRTPVPSHIKLVRSSVEEGLTQEVHGTIAASSSKTVNGHEVWIMSANGSVQGTNARITQAIARHEGSVYKVMAVTVGDGSPDDAAINAFTNSIQIMLPNSSGQSTPVADSDRPIGDGIDLHNLSVRIGGASAFVLIAAIVWFVTQRRKRRFRPQ